MWENQREHHGTITSTVCVFFLECVFSSLFVRHTRTVVLSFRNIYFKLNVYMYVRVMGFSYGKIRTDNMERWHARFVFISWEEFLHLFVRNVSILSLKNIYFRLKVINLSNGTIKTNTMKRFSLCVSFLNACFLLYSFDTQVLLSFRKYLF